MNFRQGVKVVTSEGEGIGEINRVALDPKTKEVTHIVVQKGLLFSVDKVVPVDLIEFSDAEHVRLRKGAGNLQDLPNYDETHYILLDWEELKRMDQDEGTPLLYWYPPLYPDGLFGEYVVETAAPHVEITVENIPEGSVALKEGAEVFDVQGEKVGDLEQIFTEPVSDRATHFVLSEGILLKEKKLIPMEWVSELKEDCIQMAVGSKILNALPDFQS
jgi:uncharacterized protein YrrD